MIDLKPSGEAFVALCERMADDQLSNATPCSEYSVGDLIDHVDQVCRGATALALGDDGALDAPERALRLDADWRRTIATHVGALSSAWDDPAAWRGTGNVAGSDLSNETWAKIALTELVVHGWDLAHATGRPFELPDGTLQACFDHVVVFVPNAPVPQLWGAAVTVADDAPLLDRIVAITGRTP